MMELTKLYYPPQNKWDELVKRPQLNAADLETVCANVFADIKTKGDEALLHYTAQFDKVALQTSVVSETEIDEASILLTDELKQAIKTAYDNIKTFHAAQKTKPVVLETIAGVLCRQEVRPIERVGIYIPGGTAPLFSTVLMLAIPAQLAGCTEVVMCTPPDKEGKIHPAILWAAQLCGITKIIKAGGVQAIAAMAVGTSNVPSVYKIFGPGNQYVMAAKQYAQRLGVAIDMPAGPSEVLIIADESANPDYVAADMLSQAEHGVDSQAILLTSNQTMIPLVEKAINQQLQTLPRKELTQQSLKHAKLIALSSVDECIELSNLYAPEHLILSVNNYNAYTCAIVNAGSVFLGNYSPESAGDYASGTNHTLPTSGYARNYSGVNLDAFCKKITFQELSKDGLTRLASTIETMAENEQLQAHAQAVRIRLQN